LSWRELGRRQGAGKERRRQVHRRGDNRKVSLRKYLAEQMKNPRFRKAWEEVQGENGLTRELVRLRVEHGLTQAQVAEKVGTKQAAISRLEHRPPKRPTELLCKVANLYGCEVRAHLRLVPVRAR